MTDLRQSSQYANYIESIGWKVEKIDKTYIFLKKIPLLGWFAKIQRPAILNNKIINFIEKKYHPFQFSIEPVDQKSLDLITDHHFQISNSPSLPTKTLVLDLKKSEKELLKSFSQKTRYNITRLVTKKSIKVEKSTNILDFTNFWRQNFEKKRFPFFSQQNNIIALSKSFSKNSLILLAKKDKKTIAGLFILIHNKKAYYMYAASNDEGRSNYAPTFLTWNAIQLTKKLGCTQFDFDGIYDERFPISSWQGFTKFKKGFGGKEIKYPGIYKRNRTIIKV